MPCISEHSSSVQIYEAVYSATVKIFLGLPGRNPILKTKNILFSMRGVQFSSDGRTCFYIFTGRMDFLLPSYLYDCRLNRRVLYWRLYRHTWLSIGGVVCLLLVGIVCRRWRHRRRNVTSCKRFKGNKKFLFILNSKHISVPTLILD